MRLSWASLPGASPGQWVELEGWLAPLGNPPSPGYGLLVPQPDCCAGCPPNPAHTVEILASTPLPAPMGAAIRVAGRWQALPADDAAGWRWQLTEAQPLGRVAAPGPWISRRAALAGLPLACVAATAGCTTPALAPTTEALEQGRALVAASTPMDLHSHAGRVIISRTGARPFTPVAEPMRDGGMRLIALAMVADTPVTQVVNGTRIQAVRDPEPGELVRHAEAAFDRLAEVVQTQGLAVVTDQASLRAALAPAATPAVLVAAEGADFLEGRPDRIGEAFARHRLRHLQLVHYRVNELGDIQTDYPVHNGLSAAGAAVVRECNALGVVVDLAHATLATVRGAAAASRHPIVLSHTSLNNNPPGRTRTITSEHAQAVAETGGVIGVWPPSTIFPTLQRYAEGLARLVEVVGVAHVGIGSDMLGLLGTAAYSNYRQTPELAAELLRIGFGAAEVGMLLGGNFARVLGQVLPA
jgi:membrane dipeptidase